MKLKATKFDRQNQIIELVVLPVSCLVMIILLQIEKVDGTDIIIWISTAVMVISIPILTLSSIYFCREIELGIEGCTIRIGNYQKTYFWDEMTVCLYKNDTGCGRCELKYPGILLSGVTVQKPSKILAQTNCSTFHPLASVFVRFEQGYVPGSYYWEYMAKKEELLEILKQYRVEIANFKEEDTELPGEENGTITIRPWDHSMAILGSMIALIEGVMFYVEYTIVSVPEQGAAISLTNDWFAWSICSVIILGQIVCTILCLKILEYYSRTIILDSRGCMFQSVYYTRFWTWEEMNAYYYKSPYTSKSRPNEGIILTAIPLKKSMKKYEVEDFCALKYPKVSVFIAFQPEHQKIPVVWDQGATGLEDYVLEKEKLLRILEENNVDIIYDAKYKGA